MLNNVDEIFSNILEYSRIFQVYFKIMFQVYSMMNLVRQVVMAGLSCVVNFLVTTMVDLFNRSLQHAPFPLIE